MLLLPPRHGKSELASKRYPAWLLGRNPGWQFISVSATAELASDFGRDVRNILRSQGIIKKYMNSGGWKRSRPCSRFCFNCTATEQRLDDQ